MLNSIIIMNTLDGNSINNINNRNSSNINVNSIVEQSNNNQSVIDIQQYIIVGDDLDQSLGVNKLPVKNNPLVKKVNQESRKGYYSI
jgi:hypothetical protein